jgi:hypothetical protein
MAQRPACDSPHVFVAAYQVSYPISYYGHVSVEEVDGRQIFKWNAGETVSELVREGLEGGGGPFHTVMERKQCCTDAVNVSNLCTDLQGV